MELKLNRKEFYPDRCIGGFYINDQWSYYTLEDKDRQRQAGGIIIPWSSDLKIPKQTAIPRGRYQVIIDKSDRFQRMMPHILDVPDFAGIRIHILNTPVETEGCPGIGMQYEVGTHNIVKSKLAFDDFFPKLELGLLDGDVWIEVS